MLTTYHNVCSFSERDWYHLPEKKQICWVLKPAMFLYATECLQILAFINFCKLLNVPICSSNYT